MDYIRDAIVLFRYTRGWRQPKKTKKKSPFIIFVFNIRARAVAFGFRALYVLNDARAAVALKSHRGETKVVKTWRAAGKVSLAFL